MEDVQAYNDAYSEAVTTATGETTSESGLVSTDALSQYFKDKYGDVMTDECIESMMANRTMTACIEVAEQNHMDIVPDDIQLIEKSNEAGAYTYTAMLMTASDEKEVTAASVSGEITMVDGKASDLMIKVEKDSQSSIPISTSDGISVQNIMTVELKDNDTGSLLENKTIDDEEQIAVFNQICSELKGSTDEKYSNVLFDSMTSNEYTLHFSSSDFTGTTHKKGDVVIVECNGLNYELTVGDEEWQRIADYMDSIG